jgi:hypothetical protein
MPCKKDKSETAETGKKIEGVLPEKNAPTCPCNQCPEKAKKVALAGLLAGLGFVAFRAIRRGLASA